MSEKKGFLGGLFGGKKSGGCCNMEIVEESAESCDCGGTCTGGSEEPATHTEGIMTIKILGPGCRNCVALTENVKAVLTQLKMEANIEKVTDMAVIAGYGVMSTPGLVINEELVSYGKVLKPNDIVVLLKNKQTNK